MNNFSTKEQKRLKDTRWNQVDDSRYQSGCNEIKREGKNTFLNHIKYENISNRDFEKITGIKIW